MRGFLETRYGKAFPQGSGDVVRIRIGDIVPADIEIVEGEFDESALTGESLPVEKRTVILPILTRYVGGERALGIVKATAIIFIVV